LCGWTPRILGKIVGTENYLVKFLQGDDPHVIVPSENLI
jgi:hypothetical protein